MEESEELSLCYVTHSSQRLQTNLGAAAESQGASHFTGTLPLNKPNPAPNLSGRFQPASPLGHVSVANSTPLPYQLPATNSSGDATVLKTPAWSQRSQSTSSGKTGLDDKVLSHSSAKMEGTVKVEGTANITTSRMALQAAMSKPLITQKLLQPKLQAHPTWTPPPRDYMNKALNYQVCNLTIIEVEDVLVCDACEKGYHLKCLQSRNQKAIPKEKKVGTLGKKGNQQKITANGSSGLRSAPAGNMVNYQNPSTSGSNMPNASDMQGNDILSIWENMDDKCHVQICPNDAIRTSRTACVFSADLSVERSCKEKLVVKGWSPAKSSETIAKTLDHLQASSNSQYNDQKGLSYSAGSPPKQCHDNNLTVKDSERSDSKFFMAMAMAMETLNKRSKELHDLSLLKLLELEFWPVSMLGPHQTVLMMLIGLVT
ncbi:RING/FYVE/PHD zinc finger superfamily protein [Actinidia rufa]|uniref:RING/FYVE/PHD zinc finger superfamily protein n=1 Tax=Actinidia rufa TaxID=165716 RepID=A0A7J0HF89_9ERIC|nr:RING/FYVE/PHD zinc finger superfamily protein [Actinidia rufa]